MESTESEAKAQLTLGEFLKQVREKNGLSVEYVADQLKLKMSSVRDLEANRYDRLGGVVYIKGYLRSYARLLHLNIEDQLQLDGAQSKETSASSHHASSANAKKPAQHSWLWLFLALVALLFIVGMFFVHHAKAQHISHDNVLPVPALLVPSEDSPKQPDTKIAKITSSKPIVQIESPMAEPVDPIEKPTVIEKQPQLVAKSVATQDVPSDDHASAPE